MPFRRQPLLAPRRRAFQWATTLVLLGVPFLRSEGESLLRIDLVRWRLILWGRGFDLEQFHLMLLFTLALALLFLLVTLAFGRAWCGWACPQTTLTDLVEGCARALGATVEQGRITTNRPWQPLSLQGLYLLLGLLVGANLVWYFVPPYEFFPALAAASLPPVALGALLITATVVYLDLALLRRTVCREFCPYGRFQTALIDPGTLTLRYHPDEAPRCIRCGACVRACPTGIDIRAGEQVECINCGRCLDACRRVMAGRAQPGIIRYTFGLDGRGPAALLNGRMLLVAGAFLGLTTLFGLQLAGGEPFSLKLARSATPARMLPSGQAANFFTATLIRHGSTTAEVGLRVAAETPGISLQAPPSPLLSQNQQRRRFDFALISPRPDDTPVRALLEIVDAAGVVMTSGEVYLVAPSEW